MNDVEYERIRKSVFSIVSSRDDREDALSFVCIYALENSGMKLTNRMIKWRCLDYLRMAHKHPTVSIGDYDAESVDVIRKDVDGAIKRAGLTSDEDVCLYYFFYLGLSKSDIALRMGVTRVKVSSYIKNALLKIKAEIGDIEDGYVNVWQLQDQG